MFREVSLGCVLLAGLLLVGCDDSATSNATTAVATSASDNPSLQGSNTALYLPGGLGLDFGRAPISDKITEDKTSKIRIVSYEFSESYEVIDHAVASIVEPAKYVRKVNPAGTNKLSVTYLKRDVSPVLCRYSVIVKEGFDNKTTLTLSWRF